MSSFFASELEFYLFDETYELAEAKDLRDLKTTGSYIQDYHVFQTTKEEGVMRAIRNGLQGAGIPVENSKGEWGPGQEEINVRYADPLTMADWHVILKNGCKEIAHSASVRPSPSWRNGATTLPARRATSTVALGRSGQDAALPRSQGAKHGMSALMRHFVAGQLTYAREITWFLAPYVNSYKRFQAGTFAPTKAIWSLDNRTAGFRLCGAGPRPSASNAALAAPISIPISPSPRCSPPGLPAFEQKLELEPPFVGRRLSGQGAARGAEDVA